MDSAFGAAIAAIVGVTGYRLLNQRRKKRSKANQSVHTSATGDSFHSSQSGNKQNTLQPAANDQVSSEDTTLFSSGQEFCHLNAQAPTPIQRTNRTPGIRSSISRLAAPIWLICCLAMSGWLIATNIDASPDFNKSLMRAGTIDSQMVTTPTQPIETLRVGQRLPSRNPELSNAQRATKTKVNPQTWRLLKLKVESRLEDGTPDVVNIETLQPLKWIELHNATVGATVTAPIDLADLGCPAELTATVVGIEPCPQIEDGPGQVVLTTVNHLNAFVFNLTLQDEIGHRETIGVTGRHKIYSHTRNAWVNAQDLIVGEELGYLDRPVTVVTLSRLRGTHRVYNITVEAEHVFYVSTLGALVHNNGGTPIYDPKTGTWRQPPGKNDATGRPIGGQFAKPPASGPPGHAIPSYPSSPNKPPGPRAGKGVRNR